MCTQAAKALLLQCGREYGFGEKLLKLQELLHYTCYQLKRSNNYQPIILALRESSEYLTEWLLHLLDAKIKFKAKSIQNGMTLQKSTMTILDKNTKQIFKLLKERMIGKSIKHSKRQKNS